MTSSNATSEVKINSAAEEKCCHCQCHRVPVTLRDTFFQDPFFSRSWDEFDQMRRDMIAESRLAWQKFDEEMKKLEEQRSLKTSICPHSQMIFPKEGDKVNKKATGGEEASAAGDKCSIINIERQNDDSSGLSQSWFSPIKLVRFPSLFGDDTKLQSERSSFFKEENVIKVKDDDKVFEITMDTSQYKPDELKLNVMENDLTVEAKHTEKSEDGSSFVSRQFLRKYTLPRECKHELVTSNLSADGVLVISAPKNLPQLTDNSGRTVPILRS